MKTLLIVCLALNCLGSLAGAEKASPKTASGLATNNVPGAFGVVFGKPLPSKVGSYTMDSDLEVAVRIKPPTPSPYLNLYFAKVNPATKAVYELQGWFDSADAQQRLEDYDKLAAALESKYGTAQGTTEDHSQTRVVDGVTIDLAIINNSLVLTYTNSSQKKLADKALKDRTDERTKKDVNATGL